MKTLIILIGFMTQVYAVDVTLNISNLKNRNGNLYVGAFNDSTLFPNKTPFKSIIIPTERSASVKVVLDLPQGDYAISTFLDENNNGKLDTNSLGIPKERFGFSRNPRIFSGPPTYEECEINIERENEIFEIELIKLF
jgi:uncharacterized protein (DUF2141 family)